ncbi:MAG: glutamate racemase [Clostridia bacterium]|nr:MAG: glutamate racemase [Clostridia bacterium]
MPACRIGLFDSGLGGLTVARQIWARAPEAAMLYFADTAHVPYGEKTPAELIGFADAITAFLTASGAGLIVDACNSTSAVALDYLQEKYEVPVIGVITPGAEAAARLTSNGRIGVMATRATIWSQAHLAALRRMDAGLEIFTQECPLLVPLVEEGHVDDDLALAALAQYLQPLKAAGIDTLILGCTHYPFMTSAIKAIMGPGVAVVDPAEEVGLQVASLCPAQEGAGVAHSTGGREDTFFTSGDPRKFSPLAAKLLGRNLPGRVVAVSPPPNIAILALGKN